MITEDVERKAAAETDAQKLLGELQLPEGEIEVKSDPAAGELLGGAADIPGTGHLIDCHRWWTVPGEPQSVESFIEGHPPTGSRLSGRGSGSGPGGTEWNIEYRWPTEGVLQNPSLVIQLVSLPEGRTGIRADGMVVWLAPIPPADVIPSTAKVLDIEVEDKRSPKELIFVDEVVEGSKVATVADMIDKMPQNPGAVCEGIAPLVEVRFTFRAVSGGPALAVARVPDDAEVEPTVCLPMSLSLPESGRYAMLEDGAFIREVQDLLGVQISGRTSTE